MRHVESEVFYFLRTPRALRGCYGFARLPPASDKNRAWFTFLKFSLNREAIVTNLSHGIGNLSAPGSRTVQDQPC